MRHSKSIFSRHDELRAQAEALTKHYGFATEPAPAQIEKQVDFPLLSQTTLELRQRSKKQAATNQPELIQQQVQQESFVEHESHHLATEALAPHRIELGAAYKTCHLLARWSIEHANEQDPAPHLMTCYWALEEALGVSERQLRRHLIEDGHRWSAVVRKLIDVRHNYGELLDGKDELGLDKTRPCITSMIIRFFPRTRQSENARVKRWGRRDLVADSDEGRTRPTRPVAEKTRYRRQKSRMSAHSSVKEQSQENNWLFVLIGQKVSQRSEKKNNSGSLYADIPKNHVLDALYSDLIVLLDRTRGRGGSVTRARSRWVDTAAKLIAERLQDDKPLPRHEHKLHTTHYDGFTDLWRMALWTAIKAEQYGGTNAGWRLVRDMVRLSFRGKELCKDKPTAWAWSQVRKDLLHLKRDYGSGRAGAN